MNVPKVLTIIIVIVAAALLLYPTISGALPKEMNGPPFSIKMAEGDTSVVVNDDMTFRIEMPDITFGSSLPEDLKDVKIDVYLGSWDTRLHIGQYDINVIPANGTVTKSFASENQSVFYLLSYVADMRVDETHLDLPISLGIAFKYLEWKEMGPIQFGWDDVDLLDVGLIIKASGTESEGTMDGPTVTGNKSVVSIMPEDGLVREAGMQMYNVMGPEFSVTAGDASLAVHFINDGSMEVTVDAVGGTAYDVLKKMYDADGRIVFTHGTQTYTVEGDAALALLNALKMFYPEAS